MSVATTAQDVKALRDSMGTGMMDSKRALEATNGDLEQAKDWLRQKGIVRDGVRAVRVAREGTVEIYLHHNQQLGVLVELNSETESVARTEAFRQLAREIALHIAAAGPRYSRRDDVPRAVIEQERAAFQKQVIEQRKPAALVQKIIDGKLREFYERQVLMDQVWAKDAGRTVEQVLTEAAASFGEDITVSRLARLNIQKPVEEG